MLKIANKQDILAFEQDPLPNLPSSVYEVLENSVQKYVDRTSLQFFLQGTAYQNTVAFTYTELMEKRNECSE